MRQEITKHASKHSTIKAIALPGCIRCARDELPLVRVRQQTLILVDVFVLKIAKNIVQVRLSSSTHAVVELNAFFLHKGHRTYPVHIVLINGKENLVELKNILA